MEEAEALDPETARWRARLVFFLRLNAVVELLALAGVLMPRAWMDLAHQGLLGEPLAQGPVVVYLARTVSLFYAVHGWLVWVVALDVRRFGPILTYLVLSTFIMGLATLAIDYLAGLPMYWVLGEGLSITLLGVVLLMLRRKAKLP